MHSMRVRRDPLRWLAAAAARVDELAHGLQFGRRDLSLTRRYRGQLHSRISDNGSHSTAALKHAVWNSGLRVRSQTSKPGWFRSAITRSATNARKSSSVGLRIVPPALVN